MVVQVYHRPFAFASCKFVLYNHNLVADSFLGGRCETARSCSGYGLCAAASLSFEGTGPLMRFHELNDPEGRD